MGSPDVISGKRREVSVDLLALSVGVLVVLQRIRLGRCGLSTDENGIGCNFFFVLNALSGVTSRLVESVFEPRLVVGKSAPLVSSQVEV